MSKKEKICAFAEDLNAVRTLVPKLEALIKVHKEIAAGYQKYRKNGGEAIPGIEKHLGITEEASDSAAKDNAAEVKPKLKEPQEEAEVKKSKKKKAKH